MKTQRNRKFDRIRKQFCEVFSKLVDEHHDDEEGRYYANIRNALSEDSISNEGQLKLLFLRNMCESIRYGRINVVNNIAELSTKIYDPKIRRDILRAASDMLGSKDRKSGADWANRLAADYQRGNYQDKIIAIALRDDADRMKREETASMERARIYCERINKMLAVDATFEQERAEQERAKQPRYNPKQH